MAATAPAPTAVNISAMLGRPNGDCSVLYESTGAAPRSFARFEPVDEYRTDR